MPTRAHLILAVMKALDIEQSAAFDVIHQARQRHPDWPVVVAQTSLHEGYPSGGGHLHPYPFTDAGYGDALPEALVKCLTFQRSQFKTLPGSGALR